MDVAVFCTLKEGCVHKLYSEHIASAVLTKKILPNFYMKWWKKV